MESEITQPESFWEHDLFGKLLLEAMNLLNNLIFEELDGDFEEEVHENTRTYLFKSEYSEWKKHDIKVRLVLHCLCSLSVLSN